MRLSKKRHNVLIEILIITVLVVPDIYIIKYRFGGRLCGYAYIFITIQKYLALSSEGAGAKLLRKGAKGYLISIPWPAHTHRRIRQ